MKNSLFLFLLLAVAGGTAAGQSRKIENVLRMDLRNKGNIIENDKVVGYYLFYKVDRKDRKNEIYSLQILDDNLNLAKTMEIVRPENSYLVEASFNGKSFMLMFFRKKAIDLLTYDKAGKKLGEKTFEDLPKYEVLRITQAMQNEASNLSIYPFESDGFIRHTYTKNSKYGYSIEAFDNNLKSLWELHSDVKAPLHEFADILLTSGDLIMAQILKKKTAASSKFDAFILAIDGKTGKQAFQHQLQADGGDLSLLNVFRDETTSELILSGEYFKAGKELGKDPSDGLYFQVLDLSGKQTFMKKLPWTTKELARVKSTQDENEKSHVASIYFHRMFRNKAGHLFAIGEQYRKGANAAAMVMGAAAMLGGNAPGASMIGLNIYNMVALEFDKDFNLVTAMKAEKKKTQITLPPGAGYYSSSMLALFVKATGGFDYMFSTQDKERDRFYVVYTDFNRKTGEGKEKADAMIGTILYENGALAKDRIPLNTEGTSMWVSPAKSGYISVGEYFKKKKYVQYRLEKVNY
jgi:hypothetical protein